MSKCLYGAESWVAMSGKTMKKFHAMIIRLYRRLLPRQQATDHLDDDTILVQVAQLSPLELLHRARLRYLATLVKADLEDAWALLAVDSHWTGLVEQAMVWMWDQLSNSSSLPDPRISYLPWLQLIQCSPRYWKRLVRRACEHSILQRQRRHQVREFHRAAFSRLEAVCPELPAPGRSQQDPHPETVYGCLLCKLRCQNRAGEAAHMCKAHRQVSRLRRLFDSPACPACLKHFHTLAKMKAHLYYSAACRGHLDSLSLECPVALGAGSQQDGRLEQMHDRVLPPVQAHGPLRPPIRMREVIVFNEELNEFLIQAVTEHPDPTTLEQRVRGFAENLAISWTDFEATLRYFVLNFDEDDARMFQIDITLLRDIVTKLVDPMTWDIFAETGAMPGSYLLPDWHESRCEDIAAHIVGCGFTPLPRSVGRHRVLLHAFCR